MSEVSPAESPAPASPPAKSRFGLSRVEGIALGVFAAVAVALGLGFLLSAQKGRPTDRTLRAAAHFDVPYKGALLEITKAEASWQDRVASDRGAPTAIIRPTVRLALAGSSAAYLRVTFLDAAGTPQGDLVTLRYQDGKLVDTGRGEVISGPQEVTVRGTAGYPHETEFLTYLGQAGPRWSVRLEEGADYGSGPWKTLAWVQLPNTYHQP